MRTGALPASTVAAATSKKVFKVHRRQKALSSLLAWAFSSSRVQTGTALPGRAGLYPLLSGPPFPWSTAPVAFLDWPHPVSFITFSPPKLEEPQGLEFTPAPSPGRKIRELQGKGAPLWFYL